MSAWIKARGPACTCKARDWWLCSCHEEGVDYEAAGHPWEIEETGIPTPAFVAYVAERHPGWDLIHLPLPDYLSAEYRAARGWSPLPPA